MSNWLTTPAPPKTGGELTAASMLVLFPSLDKEGLGVV